MNFNLAAALLAVSAISRAVLGQQECTIGLDLTCNVAEGSVYAGLDCAVPLPPFVEPCRDRPLASTMLYNGGDCGQSDNTQEEDKFMCQDFQGGPPTMDGVESYIVVTDAKGKGITYFEGIVRVGENYGLNNDMKPFEPDQSIMIFSGSDKADLLQAVRYHSSCSQDMELKNRFGASQLVEFLNEEQGNVSCFATLEYGMDIQIPVTMNGNEICLETLTAITNFAGMLDLSDQVRDVCVPPGGTVTVTMEAPIDGTTQQRYSILATITGTEIPSERPCNGTDFISWL
jgi:hypothetical protein